MSTLQWNPPIGSSTAEKRIAARLKRTGKLFTFLRRHRHELFDDAFQVELAAMYSDYPRGTPPLPPALLAMVTLLQAYQKASDAVAVENAVFDRRWQMVLDCPGVDKPPFSQGVLVDFRCRLIAHDMDRRLLEKTVELAKSSGGFGHKALRVALDSAPLWGAGRVEDTFNLIGHAMEVVVKCASVVAGLTPNEVRDRAGVRLLGGPSIKAALDIDWDDKVQQQEALERLLSEVTALHSWVEHNLSAEASEPPLKEALELLSRVIEQDIEPDPEGCGHRIRKGTARDRRISIRDGQMRHGRKSKSRVINGYKRHVAMDLDSRLVLAATVRPANESEYKAETDIRPDVERLGKIEELHIDRGYLAGSWSRQLHESGHTVICKPRKIRSERFTKSDFRFDFDAGLSTCPAGESAPIRKGRTGRPDRVSFPSATCRACHLRPQCMTDKQCRGRDLTLHAAEPLLQQLRDDKKTTAGRARLRERVQVEHCLAHLTARQGRRARYIGVRKNVFDVRRTAAINNLHCLLRMEAA